MTALATLKNIGETSAEWLVVVGITTKEKLEQVGPVAAYLEVKALYKDKVTIVLLYALQGALLDLHWNALPEEMKQALRAQVKAAESGNEKRRPL